MEIRVLNKYDIKVDEVESIGSNTDFYIDFPTDYVMIAKMEEISYLRIDEEVKVSFNLKQIHFFDKKSTLHIIPVDEK